MGFAGIAFGADGDVYMHWRRLISSLEQERDILFELHESYTQFPPNRVLTTPEIRASQSKRRLQLMTDEQKLMPERVEILGDLKRSEEAL